MPIRVVCPECGTTETLDARPASSVIACRQCGSKVSVPAAPSGPPPLPGAKAAPSAGFEVLDDEDDAPPPPKPPAKPPRRADDDEAEDDVPAKRPAVRKAEADEDSDVGIPRYRPGEPRPKARPKSRQVEDDADDEDDRPTRPAPVAASDDDDDRPARVRPSARADDDADNDDRPARRPSARDEDDDSDDEDRPARRPATKKPAAKKSSGKGLVLASLFAVLLAGGATAGVVYSTWEEETPPERPPVNVAFNNPLPRPAPKIDNNPGNVPPKKVDPSVDPKPPAVTELTPVPLPLGGKAKSICSTARGTKLLVNLADDKKLVVVNLITRKIDFELPTSGLDTLVAGGDHVFLVVEANSHVVRRYNSETYQMEADGPVPFDGKVHAVAMGCMTDGPCLFGTNATVEDDRIGILDVASLKAVQRRLVKSKSGEVRGKLAFPEEFTLRASPGGGTWVATTLLPQQNMPCRIVYSQTSPTFRQMTEWNEKGSHTWSPLSNFAVSRDAVVVQLQKAQLIPAPKGSQFCPSESGNLVIEVASNRSADRTTVSIHHVLGSLNTLVKRTITGAYEGSMIAKDTQVAYYAVEAPTLALLNDTGDRLDLVPFDLNKELKAERIAFSALHVPEVIDIPAGKKAIVRPIVIGSTVDLKSVSTPNTNSAAATKLPDGSFELDLQRTITGGSVVFSLPSSSKVATIRRSPPTVDTVLSSDPRTPKVNLAARPAPKKVDPMPSPMPMPKPNNVATGVKLVVPAKEPATIPVASFAERTEVALGGALRDVCVGGGGRYIVGHVPTARKIVVIDVSTGKIAQSVSVTEDRVLFAAGMSKLLIVYPELKQIVRYSLGSNKVEADADVDFQPRPSVVGIGSATNGPLILVGPTTGGNQGKISVMFIDIESLKEVVVDQVVGDHKVSFGSPVNMRVSPDGKYFTAWYTQLQPSGVQVVHLNNNMMTGHYQPDSVGHVLPAGDRLFTEKAIYSSRAELQSKGIAEMLLPGTSAAGTIQVTDGANGAKKIAVREGDKVVKEWSDLPGFDGKKDPFERESTTISIDKRLIYIPEAKVLAVVPSAANKIILVPAK